MNRIHIVKRDGFSELVSFDKVLTRLEKLANMHPALTNVNYDELAKDVIGGIYAGVHTTQLDELASHLAHVKSYGHPEWDTLAARIAISNYHKNCEYNLQDHFSYQKKERGLDRENHYYLTCKALYENIDENGVQSPLLSPVLFKIIEDNQYEIEKVIKYDRDYTYKYMGFETLKGSYLSKCSLFTKTGEKKWVPIEKPQHMIMRVSLGIHCASEYVDFNKMRVDHMKIWNAVSDELKDRLNRDTYSKYYKMNKRGQVDWNKLITLLSNHTSSHMYGKDLLVLKIKKTVTENTLSWEELLISERLSGLVESGKKCLDAAFETYDLMSKGLFTHATPTLFNAGTLKPQCSSCYLMMMAYDGLDEIADYWKNAAAISKWAGGLASNIHNIRPKGAYIRGTNGRSNGIVPLLKVSDGVSVYVDQGGNKRPGTHAVYLEPWCGDIFEFVQLKKQRGNEEQRARHLFYAMWIPDEFMRRLTAEKDNEELWYLMNPDVCVGLSDVYDSTLCTTWISDEEVEKRADEFAFTRLYRQYIREGKYIAQVPASKLWKEICLTIIETGVPYMLFKDSCNRKSNQNNLGTIKCSNLCCEIVEFSAPDEVAVCNLVSICINKFIVPCGADEDGPDVIRTFMNETYKYDQQVLEEVTRVAVRNLNKIIDINYYPLQEAINSNKKHRPLGIGVQGLADLFAVLRMPFDSVEAKKLAFYIFETMYFAALDESANLAEKFGPYDSYAGSPQSKGLFQFDLWNIEQGVEGRNPVRFPLSRNWEALRTKIIGTEGGVGTGIRNSLLMADMPTGSTSEIMGNSPCFEPYGAIFYKRRNKTNEYVIVNNYLADDLIKLGLWNDTIRNKIQADERGSIADIEEIPIDIRNIYKTAWDVKLKDQIDHALVRGVFIDQSQSFSWFVDRPTVKVLSSFHHYSWRHGQKTSSYYTRRLAVMNAQKIQVVTSTSEEKEEHDCGNQGFCGA